MKLNKFSRFFLGLQMNTQTSFNLYRNFTISILGVKEITNFEIADTEEAISFNTS